MSLESPKQFADVMEAGGWVLAFDTSEDFGSVAVARFDDSGTMSDVVVRSIEERRAQASKLVPTIQAALAGADIQVGDLSAVVVGAGPGSFTGVRVSASTAKGLVFGAPLPLWSPSSLEGAALDPIWGGTQVRAVAFDARGDRVYAAIYTMSGNGPPKVTMAPEATNIDVFAQTALDLGASIGGSAARRHRDLDAFQGVTIQEAPCGDPSALGLIQALALDPERRAAENPWTFEPLYLRGSSAQPSQPPVMP